MQFPEGLENTPLTNLEVEQYPLWIVEPHHRWPNIARLEGTELCSHSQPCTP